MQDCKMVSGHSSPLLNAQHANSLIWSSFKIKMYICVSRQKAVGDEVSRKSCSEYFHLRHISSQFNGRWTKYSFGSSLRPDLYFTALSNMGFATIHKPTSGGFPSQLDAESKKSFFSVKTQLLRNQPWQHQTRRQRCPFVYLLSLQGP